MKTRITKAMAALVLLAVVMMAGGCKEPVSAPRVAIVEDSVVVSHDKAVLYAKVIDEGNAEITGRGFSYGKVGGPTDTVMCSADVFSVEVSNLSPSTAYTCKAFAVNEAGWGFSDEFSFTTLGDPVPVVKTYNPTDLTHATAVVPGRVVSDGGQEVTERGVCYSTHEHPTVGDSKVTSGTGVGSFTCQLTGLAPMTVYYVRAYAITSVSVYYGEEKFLLTDCLPLEVRTEAVSDVTATRVKVEGEVVRDNCREVLERGFCWSTEHLPTIDEHRVMAGSGVGVFSRYFSVFERGVTHYVRAYAIDEENVAYGEELEFLPDDPFMPWPGGASPGLFSVSEDHQVRFSQGNLQYNPSACVWRFAEHQWDFVGGVWQDYQYGIKHPMGTVYKDGVKCDNALTFGNYEGWMDLFCWGTSGWNCGNIYYHPYDYAGSVHNFFGPPGDYDLTGSYAQADWGVYNIITNGSSRQWRTPSADEINYLLLERVTPSGIRFVKAEVAGIGGLVVLPDDWDASTYHFKAANWNMDYSANIISGASWLDVLEPAGAVFLPAAGYLWAYYFPSGFTERFYENSETSSSESMGYYWTVTQGIGVNKATALAFYGSSDGGYYEYFTTPYHSRCDGHSVRLISDE